MCGVLLGQLLIFVIVGASQGEDSTKSVNISITRCNKSFPCNVSQARAVVLAEEIQIDRQTVPHMVVLHRCDGGSGCCPQDEICQVAQEEIINATVIVDVNDYSKDGNPKYEPRYFTLTNHTNCSCQNRKTSPK